MGLFSGRNQKKSANNIFVTLVDNQFSKIFGTASKPSDSQLIDNVETIPDVFLITDYIASKIANIPIKVVNKKGKDVTNQELSALIEAPNGYQSWGELIKLFFAYYEPLGNAYFYALRPDGMKAVSQLWCLPVDKTQIILLRDKSLPAWMNEVYGYKVNIGGKDYNLPAENVFHEKYFSLRYNDGSWAYGISKYIPGDKINRELKAIHEAKTSIVEQRGALGFITNESEIPDAEQSKLVKEKLQESYGLGLDKDKVIVTTEKLKWQQMALGVAELQLIENAKYSFDKLCQLSGFDPVIFSTEGSTFANKQEAVKELMLKVIKPKIESFYKSLSFFLNPGGDLIVPDWSKVEELQDDRKLLTDLVTRQVESMIITPYKAAQILYGQEAEQNPPPDEYFRKSSLVPIAEPVPDPNVVDPAAVRQLVENSQNDGN